MKRAETQTEFDEFVASTAGAEYLASDEFEARWQRLVDRFHAGEEMTVANAAECVGLPVNIFRHIYGALLAAECIAMGAPTTRSLN